MLDANIIISAILFPKSIISETIKHIVANTSIILSQYTIDEVIKVFNKKFPHRIDEMELFFEKLPHRIFPLQKIDSKKYPAIRDIDDVPVLAYAIESKADILLTGDKDFIDVKVEGMKILKPNQYKDEYIN